MSDGPARRSIAGLLSAGYPATSCANPKSGSHPTPVGLRLRRSALRIGHYHQTVGEQPAVRRRDRHRHGQTFTVEVLEELRLPREISLAPGTETTDREVP